VKYFFIENLDEILKLFKGRNLNKEIAGVGQAEFNRMAKLLLNKGYVDKILPVDEVSDDCAIIMLNDFGMKAKSKK